jgi:hypothetical protein
MTYAVNQGVRIQHNGLVFVAGDKIDDGQLPAEHVSELLEAGHIVKDEPEAAKRKRGGAEE